MSDNNLFLVPVDPQWQPLPEAADAAVALFETMGDPRAIDCELFDVIQIFHPFANWDGVLCPSCHADVDDWFHEQVDHLTFTGQRTCLDATTPCCGTSVSLNDLDFVWPCGFGRFVLRGENAGATPNRNQIAALEASLGTKLKAIWQNI